MAFPKLGDLKMRKPQTTGVFPHWVCYQTPCKNEIIKKAPRGTRGEEKNKNYLKKYYNLAAKTHFWAWLKFNSFANFDPLMTNDGALKLLDQGGFVLSLLVGGRYNYKNKLLVQGKQIVLKSSQTHKALNAWHTKP